MSDRPASADGPEEKRIVNALPGRRSEEAWETHEPARALPVSIRLARLT
jgi:hypothetical protein